MAFAVLGALNLLGYRREEIIAKPLDIIFILNKPKNISLEKFIKNEFIQEKREFYRTKNNKNIPMLVSAFILYGEKNKKVLFTAHKILTTQHEISKIKSSGRNLKKYQKLKLFKTIADKIHYGIVVTNLTGRIKYVNPYYAKVHGYRQKELLGEKMSVFHTNKQIKDYKEKYHIWFKTGYFREDKIYHKRKDGTTFPMFMNGVIIKNKLAKPVYLAYFAIDITEKVNTENDLKKSEEWIDLALKCGDLGIWNWNIKTDRITFNDTSLKMLGYIGDKNISYYTLWENLVHPDDKGKLKQTIMRHLKSKKYFFSVELRIHTGSGEWKWILYRGKVMKRNSNGEALSVSGTQLDITELKQTEEQLKASLMEKDVLLRELHHRVKNNLQLIISMLNMQMRQIENNETKDILIDLKNRIYSMAVVHENLYESDNFTKINFTRYIKKLITAIFSSYKIDQKRVEFNIKADNIELGIEESIYSGLIINEIVLNALKHAFIGRDTGKVDIKIYKKIDGNIVVMVNDNGVGMPKGSYKKNSFGLKLISILVKQLGAVLTIDSSGGTSFKFYFKETIHPEAN